MWAIRAVLIFVVVAAIVGFLIYNATLDQRVAVNLYWKQYDNVPLLIALFWAFAGGMFFSLVLFVGVYIKQLSQISSAKRAIRGLNEEVAALRNRPIEESRDMFGDQAAPSKTADISQ